MEDEPCLVQVNTSPTSPRALPASRTFPSPVLNAEAATTRLAVVPTAVAALDAMPWLRAPYTTWVTLALVILSILSFPTRNIAAATATAASRLICPTWLCPSAFTPAVFSDWLSAWSLRTVCPTRLPVGTFGATTAFSSPTPPFKTGSRRLGKKKRDTLWSTYLDEALADFSGYLAIDEVYDDPFCILSVVDNRRYNRLAFRVLEDDPTRGHVLAFLSKLKRQLDKRGLSVCGITTDGSSLYPKVLKKLWPKARHQICKFHVIKEITKAILHALAKLRKEMTAQIPKQGRGRPRNEQQGQAWLIAQKKQRVADLFEHRYLFVRHHKSPAQQQQLQKLMYGWPELRTLRKIMDEVYRLFDRRCKTQTALQKLQRLRRRVRGFKKLGRSLDKLKSPTLEKALEFLDDKLLGATSNAVERANRRFRKAQNSIYSARTREHLEQRLALDMQREQRAAKRAESLKALHHARSDPESGHP
jgi:hypothetical protein